MHLTWRVMSGQMPRLEPHLLPEINAQKAMNVKLWTGGVEPLRGASYVAPTNKAGTKLTIYRDGQHIDDDTKYWFSFNGDVDITRGPIVDDELGRLYYSGDGVPKMTNSLIGWADPGAMPLAFYNLGIPAPNQPSIAFSGEPTPDAEPVTIVAGYAYVSADGFIGPMSPVAGPLPHLPGRTLTLYNLQTGPSGNYNLTKKYLFVAQTDSEGTTALRFWQEALIATTSVSGTIDFDILGEEADNPSLIAPPADLFGLMLHPNGFLVGFTKRKYLRSEVFKPHGWPSAYQDPIGDDIVGGGIIGQQVIICTKGKTYSAIGSDPLNQQLVDLAGIQPCVSKRSIKSLPFGVVYASPDGLVLAGGNLGPLAVISEGYFTRDQWQAFKPASMHAGTHDRRLYLFWDNGTTRGCLIFEFEPTGRIHLVVESDLWFSATFTDSRRDEMFVAGEDGEIYKWDSGEVLQSLWRSREVRMARAENIGAVRVIAEQYPVTFRLYDTRREGTKMVTKLVSEVQITTDRPERLHARDRYNNVHWEVLSKFPYTQVDIGSLQDILRG